MAREAVPDLTSDAEWSVGGGEPVKPLKRPATLDEIRSHELLGKMMILCRGRTAGGSHVRSCQTGDERWTGFCRQTSGPDTLELPVRPSSSPAPRNRP